MIDSIRIRLPLKPLNPIKQLPQLVVPNSYRNDDDFRPIPLSHIWNYSEQPYVSTILNPGKTIAKGSRYTPTYIGEKIINYDGLGVGHFLCIEASLPKLLYGNNVEELPPGKITLRDVMEAINECLIHDLGFGYSEQELRSAQVIKLHVGKNVLFDDPGAPTTIVRTICKAAVDGRYDNNEVRFENKGYAFKLHSNFKEVIGYDKKSDLAQSFKSLKRAIDASINEGLKDDDSPMASLLSDKSTGVFRLEVRLNNTNHIKKAFPELKGDLSLENVFLNARIMPYLACEWQKLTKDVSLIELGRSSVLTLFEAIAADHKSNGYSLRDALAVAAATHIVGENSMDYLRRIVEKYYGREQWYRLRKKIISQEPKNSRLFKRIAAELDKYKPIQLLAEA